MATPGKIIEACVKDLIPALVTCEVSVMPGLIADDPLGPELEPI